MAGRVEGSLASKVEAARREERFNVNNTHTLHLAQIVWGATDRQQTDRQKDGQTDKRNRQIDIQTDRQAGRQTDRQIDRHITDRQTQTSSRQVAMSRVYTYLQYITGGA